MGEMCIIIEADFLIYVIVTELNLNQQSCPGGRLCSFSPCIEQVQKTCEALQSAGFTEVVALECLRREYRVQNRTFPVAEEEFQVCLATL